MARTTATLVMALSLAGCGPDCEELPMEPCDVSSGIRSSSAAMILDGRRIVTLEGEPYPLVGINRFNIYDTESNGGELDLESYLDELAKVGMTLVRVFVPEGRRLEPEVGTYDEAALEAIDGTLDAAWERRIGIIVALFDHYVFRNDWESTAYGIFGDDSRALFRDPAAVEAARARTATLVERWRDHPALAAWEPINELNGVHQIYDDADGSNRDEALVWFDVISREIIEHDPRGHLITQSLIGNRSWPELWSHAALDVIQLHVYPWHDEPTDLAPLIDDLITDHEVYGKPVIIGEIGVETGDACRVPSLRAVVETAALDGSAAFIWTHVDDPFGDIVPDELPHIYGSARCLLTPGL